MEWIPIITTAILFYGAGLSTIKLVSSGKKRRRKLTIHITEGVSGSGQDVIVIQVKNPPGYSTVTFDSPQIILPNDEIIIILNPLNDVRFPYELTEGNHCPIIFSKQDVKSRATEAGYSGVIKLRAKVVDGADNAYISKTAFELNLS